MVTMTDDLNHTLRRLIPPLQLLRQRALALETAYEAQLHEIAPAHLNSARNLLHYLAVRQSDICDLQAELAALGLNALANMESATLATVNAALAAAHSLAGEPLPPGVLTEPPVGMQNGGELLGDYSRRLLGAPCGQRALSIMVTMPSEAATNPDLVRDLLAAGMDVMRIDCAYDGPQAGGEMIGHCRQAEQELGRKCQIFADLAGPRLRTGAIEAAGRVVKYQPRRDLRGRVVEPAQLRFVAAEGREIPSADAIPLPKAMWEQIRPKDELKFKDTRGRNRILTITGQEGDAWLATSEYTCYVETGITIRLVRRGQRIARAQVGLLPEVVLPLALHAGDLLTLVPSGKAGRPARYDSQGVVVEPARIPCTLDAVFDAARPGERVWFDEGKIGGVVTANEGSRITLSITQVPPGGARLKADRAIHLPDTALDIAALTGKDQDALAFLAPRVDVVGLACVRTPEDIERLHRELARLHAGHLGVVLRIETRQAVETLPRLLLTALRRPPAGILLPRDRLAVELGLEQLADVQAEIQGLCAAAHVPVIWAAQMQEGQARNGQPGRADMIDALTIDHAACVMLNKGPHLASTVQQMSALLERMQVYRTKKRAALRKLTVSPQ